MTVRASHAAENLALELDGEFAGFATSVEGGNPTADVVTERVGSDGIVRKHIAGVKYEDITISCGTGMSKGFFEWLTATVDRTPSRKSGTIIWADVDLMERQRLNFSNGLVSEIVFPALDAATKDAASLTVKISAQSTRRLTDQRGRRLAAELAAQKRWTPSNFRLQIDGLDCTHVSKIDSITVRQVPTDGGYLDIPNLVVTLPESSAESFRDWVEDFLVKGNSGQDAEKEGTLEYLAPDLREVYARLTFRNLGIFKLTRVPANRDRARTVRAEMYCEDMAFQHLS